VSSARLTLDEIRARRSAWTPAQRAAVVRQARAQKRARRRRPLAFARLWHREAPRTSQRETVRAMLAPGVLLGFTLGGNRTGKSESGAMVDVAYALGRDHPDVQEWGRRNLLDLSEIQPGPGNVWVVARTDSDSRRYVRPKVAKYLPEGCVWRNRDGDGEAEVTLPNGGKITFKSVKQGREGMQGDACHMIRFDEEPKDFGVVEECLMRLVDFAGRMLFTMTPLMGWTELLRKYVQKPTADTVIRWLHGEDNPHIRADVLRRMLSKYGPHVQAARARGEITALEGRVWALIREDGHGNPVHVVRSFRVPDSWPRYVGIDWGTSVPTAILLLAYDDRTDTIHVLAEVYRAEMTIPDRARAIRDLETGHPPVDLRWADPEDASTNRTLTLEYDIPLAKARKDIQYGCDVVASRLQLDALGKPHLVIHDCCENLLMEMDGYVFEPGTNKPRKGNDHACDALRYAVVGISRTYGLAPPLPTDGEREAA
jgi:phage terminase large subunit-like protein